MQIKFKSTSQFSLKEPTILTFFEGLFPTCTCAEIKDSYSKTKAIFSQIESFDGHYGELDCLAIEADKKISKIVGLGLGKKAELDRDKYRALGAKLADFLIKHKMKEASVVLSAKDEDIAEFAYGLYSKAYRFNKYFNDKLDSKTITLKKVTIVTLEDKKAAHAFEYHKGVLEGVYLTRDLVSEPPCFLYPESFADEALKLKKLGVKVTVLHKKQLEKMGMNAILAVGAGSEKPSCLVTMEYHGTKSTKDLVAVVGKGITFDSGGINIKPSQNLGDMKYDMAGAGVVTGLMHSLAARKAKVNVVGVIALAENMPSGSAQRPSDVIRSLSGMTIEVDNTDAEGRLVLADALWYVQTTFKPKQIIDLATLTGAVVVALGDGHAGLFANNDDLAAGLLKAGLASGEHLWRLPLGTHYDNQINSDIADVRNTGDGRGGGSITAAQFLQRFIKDGTAWAHLDIAGMAWIKKPTEHTPKGATGYGVYLLNEYLRTNFEK